MLRTILCLMFPLVLGATQSLSSGSASGALPTGAPWNSLTNFRVELRIHAWSSIASYEPIYETNSFYIRAQPGNAFLITSWADASAACGAAVPPGTDVIIRLQRVAATNVLTGEAFSASTGAVISNASCPISIPGTPNDAGSPLNIGTGSDSGSFAGKIAYIRTYSTVVAVGTPPGNTYNGTLNDFEFEGSLTDQTGHSTLTGSSPVYSTTPAYPPAVIFNTWPAINTFRAGGSITLASASFSATDNATLGYFWQQLSGPMSGQFSNRLAPNPTFSATLAGTYGIELTVTDPSGLGASATANFGAVATDSNGVVVSNLPSTMDNIVGPLLMAGKSPWPYFDLAEISTGSSIASAALANPPILGTQVSGTVTICANESVEICGIGTHFTTDLAGNPSVILAWNSVDGSGTGRLTAVVNGITDDTHASLNIYYTGVTAGTPVNLYFYPASTSTFTLGWWNNGNIGTFWNFYDVALALYRLYYRTGNVTYLTQARQFADYNWQWMLDHGYGFPPPRGASLVSQFLRALDGHAERFPGLYNWINYTHANLHNDTPSNAPFWDTREDGYEHWFIAMGAKTDTDPTRHAQYCSWLTSLTPGWNSALTSQGYWPESIFTGNPGYVAAPLTSSPLQYGASPWRMNIAVKAMEAAYESLNDQSSQGCNNTAVAAAALTTITNAIKFERNYGRSALNRGIFYDSEYQSNSNAGCQFVSTPCNGTASASLGSPIVAGLGSNFQSVMQCDGTDFVGFWTSLTIYRVASCQSQTQITLTTNFGSQGESAGISGSVWRWAPVSSTSCAGSLSTYCNSDPPITAPNGDRDLTRLASGPTAWLYNQTGNPTYLSWADEWFSSSWGGPIIGPNANGGIGGFDTADACGGPNCDGFITEYVASLPNCATPNPPPCTPGGNPYGNLGKNFGEGSGAPGADNELAWRLGGRLPAINRTVYVGFNLASVHNATQVRVTLTQPSGAVVTQICSSSPCAVQAEARQGNHLAQLTYLSATSQTLAMEDPTVVVVR